MGVEKGEKFILLLRSKHYFMSFKLCLNKVRNAQF